MRQRFVTALLTGLTLSAAASAAVPEQVWPEAERVVDARATACVGPGNEADKDAFRALAACEARAKELPAGFALAVMEIESFYDPEARRRGWPNAGDARDRTTDGFSRHTR
jgi:hypothetical protein